jgi:hypothetical protein
MAVRIALFVLAHIALFAVAAGLSVTSSTTANSEGYDQLVTTEVRSE